MTELIREDDTLNQGRKKLNNAIKAFNETVVEGDSSVEAAQARVDAEGNTFTTLKERLDTKETQFASQLAHTVQEIGDKTNLPEWLQESIREVIQKHDDAIRQLVINVRQPPYNAPADGMSHPLSERYTSLEEAQKIYTAATSLEDEMDWAAIQSAIDYANSSGIRKVFIPSGSYLIDKSIVGNGCTIIGDVSNIFSGNVGTRILAKTDDFIAIKQGSVASKDIQFNIKDIYVEGSQIGFEIVYAINSVFERLYVKNSDIGYKLGDLSAVGSMFCEFNNLYTSGTRIGAIVRSKDYFNNNRFNNGFIYGTEKAFHLEVQGGYGAINNVFNNVEFRSPLGRGIVMRSAVNTTFNNPYFECGASAIYFENFCPTVINDPIFGLFKANNDFGDNSFIYAAGGASLTLDGGIIFLTSENANKLFYDATDPMTHLNINVKRTIRTEGSATGFKLFGRAVNEMAYKKEEQIITTPTVTVPAGGFVDVEFVYPTPFSKTPDVCIPTLRGSGFQGNTLYHAILSESRADGGSIRIYNGSTSTDRQIYFSIYAKIL